jgi:hypothetical protein
MRSPLYEQFKAKRAAEKEKAAKLENVAGSGGGNWNNGTGTDSDLRYKAYEQYKTVSGRYACPSSVSPVWKAAKHFKGKYRTNGLRGREKEYYRWDYTHSDIEYFDDKGRYLGSKDPVTGNRYRHGSLEVNEQLKKVLK